MKLNIKEIKYIRQSLEHRFIYYESKSDYKQFADELKPIIKKFKKLEGLKGLSFTEINHKQNKEINHEAEFEKHEKLWEIKS
tara:strand:+ start:419 stop:664 length:246 start_codon:yes stop_codon:yes gene_type:complete